MAAEISGYTLWVHSSEGEDLLISQFPGYPVGGTQSGYEDWLWSVADSMKSFAEGVTPSFTWTANVQRHEKEDITLTHP